MNGLTLHCGASSVTRDAVINTPVPAPTDTWFPIAHEVLIQRVEQSLASLGMKVNDQCHALTKNGSRYFGLLQVESPRQSGSDYSYVVGLRNAHDQSFSASLSVGSRVFVCDNLAFTGEITIARKHTRFMERDLPILTSRAVGLLSQKWTSMDERIALYKRSEVNDSTAHDLIVRSLDCGAITNNQIPKILNEWRQPRHPEFVECGKTVWRLLNSFTEVAKTNPTQELAPRTIRLQGLLDTHLGFSMDRGISTEGLEQDAAQISVNN
jgi:hypothetical protein